MMLSALVLIPLFAGLALLPDWGGHDGDAEEGEDLALGDDTQSATSAGAPDLLDAAMAHAAPQGALSSDLISGDLIDEERADLFYDPAPEAAFDTMLADDGALMADPFPLARFDTGDAPLIEIGQDPETGDALIIADAVIIAQVIGVEPDEISLDAAAELYGL